MKTPAIDAFDQLLLRKRSIVKTINDQLKNIFDLKHSGHRSLTNYLSNIMAGLVAYSYQEKNRLSICMRLIYYLSPKSSNRIEVNYVVGESKSFAIASGLEGK